MSTSPKVKLGVCIFLHALIVFTTLDLGWVLSGITTDPARVTSQVALFWLVMGWIWVLAITWHLHKVLWEVTKRARAAIPRKRTYLTSAEVEAKLDEALAMTPAERSALVARTDSMSPAEIAAAESR